MKEKDIEHLQDFLRRGVPITSPETLFSRVKARFDAEQSPMHAQYATLLLSIKNDDEPVAGAEISLTDRLGEPLQWNGTRVSTKEGRGLISLPLSLAHNKPTLQVSFSKDLKNTISIKQMTPSYSGKKKYEMGSYSLETEWQSDHAEPPEKQHQERTRRFNIAIICDADNFDETKSFVLRHGCFRLKQVFIEGKQPKDITLPKKVPVAASDKNIESNLGDVDAVLDFCESELLQKLYIRQVQGERKISALIIPAQRFLGKIDQLEQALLPVDVLNKEKGE